MEKELLRQKQNFDNALLKIYVKCYNELTDSVKEMRIYMKLINEHIKLKEYENVYLIYGDETYLKKQYKNKLKTAITDDDTMNYSYFEGDKISVRAVIEIGNTLPFFAEKRLIIIEESGFFKSSNEELAAFVKSIPEYLIMIFVESEVDKRNKLYKAVKEKGYISEMKPQTTAVLEKWIAGLFREQGKAADKEAITLLLEKTGGNMEIIKAETDKLLSYCMNEPQITKKAVEQICTTQTVSRIFDMIAAIAVKRQQQALALYYDLLTLKEPPMKILYLLVKQFNGILQVSEQLSKGETSADIARQMGVAPFIVSKYVSQTKYFSREQLEQALLDCADIEESVKLGKINDKMGVELIIVKYSSKK